MEEKKQRILVLDFDGVICASALELGNSAWITASRVWPSVPGAPPPEFGEFFTAARPFLEIGYEAVLMAKIFADNRCPINTDNLHDLIKEELSQSAYSAQDLSNKLGGVRDERFGREQDVWLNENSMYPGITAALGRWLEDEESNTVTFIATTKQRRFALALLRSAGLEWREDRLYGLEDGPKYKVLPQIVSQFPNAVVRFVEDRLATLEALPQTGDFLRLEKYLALWGYVNEQQRESLKLRSDIAALTLEQFTKW